MLLVPVPWAGRIMALLFLTILAPSKRFYDTKARAPKTLLDWARQAALQISRWLPDRNIVVVADSAFGPMSSGPLTDMRRLLGEQVAPSGKCTSFARIMRLAHQASHFPPAGPEPNHVARIIEQRRLRHSQSQ